MTHWENNYGDVFETEEQARENAVQEMSWDDICEYFKTVMTFDDLFDTVRRRMRNFYEEFEMEIMDAEDDYFNKNYHECP